MSYLLFLMGLFPSSAVGTSCSPGRIHRMGPSLDSCGSISTADIGPQGIVYRNYNNIENNTLKENVTLLKVFKSYKL